MKKTLFPTLALLLAPACAAPCSDDGFGQHCDARQAAATSEAATTTGTTAVVSSAEGVGSSSEDDGTTRADDTGDPSASEDTGGVDTSSTSESGDPSSEDTTGPPMMVDLSGSSIVQTDSAQELVLPEGTILAPGDRLVVARDATQAEFEAFWGVALGDDVVYVDSLDALPILNGDETFTLLTPQNGVVEGPTAPLVENTALVRIDADADAGDADAWAVGEDPNGDATPGEAEEIGGSPGAPYFAEIVDPIGVGAFAFEYVEIRVAP